MPPPIIIASNSTTATIQWSPPVDSEDIIVSYQIEYVPLRFVDDLFNGRTRRQVSQIQDVLNCLEFLNSTTTSASDGSIVLTNISPSINIITLTGLG